jgi:hypothetical protein
MTIASVRRSAMRVFLAAVLAAIVIAGAAMLVLDRWWVPADQAFTSPTSVRIPSHGNTHNLVGKTWFSGTDH